MLSEVRVEIWDPEGRKHGARLVHQGGGLLTLALEVSAQPKFVIGARVRWRDLPAARSLARTGTIASTYTSGGFINLVVSPESARNVTPEPRPAPASTGRSNAAASPHPGLIRPRATIVARGEVAVGDLRSIAGETVVVYVNAAAAPLLPPTASVKLWIQLPTGRSLHFWARIRELRVLHRGALCRLDLDSSVPVFEEQFAILVRTFGRAPGAASPVPRERTSLASE